MRSETVGFSVNRRENHFRNLNVSVFIESQRIEPVNLTRLIVSYKVLPV
jgi:hypothetical protein